MLNIVLFGPPGAGKGTQSEQLISKYQLVHLSTGDILRGEIAGGTALGMEAKKLMDAGILVPDEVVIGMISSKLDQNPYAGGFIFDGFPRTTAQAAALDILLAEKDTEITMMLALEVSDEELTKRLLLRGADSGRADDRNEEIIRNRIREYNNKTAPLKNYYSAQNKFHSVYGIGSVEEIFNELCGVINASQMPSMKEEMPKRVMLEESEVKSEKSEVRSKPAKKKTDAKKKTAVKKKAVAKKAARKKPTAKKKVVKKAIKKKTAAKKKVVVKKKIVVKKKAAKKVLKKTVKKKLAAKKAAKKVVKKAVKKVVKKRVAAKKIISKKAAKRSGKKMGKTRGSGSSGVNTG